MPTDTGRDWCAGKDGCAIVKKDVVVMSSRTPMLMFVSAICAAMLSACTSSPAQPSSTAGTLIAPAPASPTSGSTVAYATLPVKLVVANATVVSGGTPTYTFEVAYDAGFSSKVATLSGVTQGTNGQTTAVFSSLLANNTYYWHARADLGSVSGAFSTTSSFTVGAQVTLSAPGLVGPANNSVVIPRPTLTVTDVTKTGAAGTISYKFEISDNAGFSTTAASGSVTEASGQTSYTPSADLTIGKTYYWRATASDPASGATSVTATFSFTTTTPTTAGTLAAVQGLQLWTGASPSGAAGQAVLGNNWSVQTVVSFNGVQFISPTIEEIRIFDLLDHGYTPQGALDWMNGNGYPTTAVAYDEGGGVTAIGFPYSYIANSHGPWDITIRVGA